MKYILFLIVYINIIYCISDFEIKCPYDICGNFTIGTTCYGIWTEAYINCITYLNRYNINVISCNNYFNYNKYNKGLYVNNEIINIIRSCKKKNNKNDGFTNDSYILNTDVKNYLNAKCLYNFKNKLILENNNIICNFEKL